MIKVLAAIFASAVAEDEFMTRQLTVVATGDFIEYKDHKWSDGDYLLFQCPTSVTGGDTASTTGGFARNKIYKAIVAAGNEKVKFQLSEACVGATAQFSVCSTSTAKSIATSSKINAECTLTKLDFANRIWMSDATANTAPGEFLTTVTSATEGGVALTGANSKCGGKAAATKDGIEAWVSGAGWVTPVKETVVNYRCTTTANQVALSLLTSATFTKIETLKAGAGVDAAKTSAIIPFKLDAAGNKISMKPAEKGPAVTPSSAYRASVGAAVVTAATLLF